MVYGHAKMAVFTATLKCRILVFSRPKQGVKTSLRQGSISWGPMGHRPKVNEEKSITSYTIIYWRPQGPDSCAPCVASATRTTHVGPDPDIIGGLKHKFQVSSMPCQYYVVSAGLGSTVR